MPTVVPVRFRYAVRDLWFDPADADPIEGDHVICSTARGTEIGLVTHDPVEEDEAALEAATDGSELKPVLRVADEEDLARAEELSDKGDAAMATFRSLVDELGLDMKPVGVEYLFGGEKAVCYFAAEERVDFRQLVREMARTLHERIDMRQIGVREEAALVGGYAHCGQELCCARFGTQFEPVSIRMAKEQDLPLNSSKISGVCGRLMCCLRYEFEAYRDFKQRAPKKNAVIDTPLGKAKIVEYDTPKEELVLRVENGKQIRVALASMTASEAAHKKSEELGCPCRPDTVTRDALEALDSPEVKMALAEIDRANGVVPAEEYQSEDIFVEPRRKRRRSSSQREEGASEGQQGQRKRSQRRHGPEAEAESGAKSAAAGDAAEGADKPKRRRRRRSGGKGGQQGQASSQQRGEAGAKQGGPKRGGSGKEGAKGQAKRGEKATAEGQAAPKPRTRRRHPGDRGGQTSRPAQGGGQAQGGERQASAEHGGEAERKPRPRRRHRGSGNGGQGAGGERQQGSD